MISLNAKFENPGILFSSGSFYFEKTFIKPYNKRDIFVNHNEDCLFKNIWNGIDVKYTCSFKSLKEIITIRSNDASHLLRFKISSNMKISKKGNDIIATNKKEGVNIKVSGINVVDKNEETISGCFQINLDEKTNIYEIKIKKQDESQYPLRII